MEVYQLLNGSQATGAGSAFKLGGWRLPLGSIPVQIYTTQATAFVGTVKLQGSVTTGGELNAGNNRWSDMEGALWTGETIDTLFAQPAYIRAYVTAWTSGKIYMRIGY